MKEPFFIFYQVAMATSLLGSIFLIILIRRFRSSNGAWALIALVIATFIWTLGFLLEANTDTLAQQLFFNNIGYLGSMFVPVFWIVFALQYTDPGKQNRWAEFIPLFIVPIVITIFIWSNGYHHLMWSNEHLTNSGPFLVTEKTYGPLFWLALTYSYILVFSGAIHLLHNLLVGPSLYTKQAISLIVAASVPLIWNSIYIFKMVPGLSKDLTPAAFTISEIAIALGLMRFRLLTAVPFSRRLLAEHLSDGFLVFNSELRLLEINPAALRITAADKNIIGKKLDELAEISPLFARISKLETGCIELGLIVSGRNRHFDVEITPMLDNKKRQIGWLATLHDTTKNLSS